MLFRHLLVIVLLKGEEFLGFSKWRLHFLLLQYSDLIAWEVPALAKKRLLYKQENGRGFIPYLVYYKPLIKGTIVISFKEAWLYANVVARCYGKKQE